MTIWRFLFSISDPKTEDVKIEHTMFQAESLAQAQVLVEAFVILRLGQLYNPEFIDTHWKVENRIFGVVLGPKNTSQQIPSLAGERIPFLAGKLISEDEFKAQQNAETEDEPVDLKTLEMPGV